MTSLIVTTSIYSILFPFIFYLSEWLRHRFPNLKELSRKSAHILSGLTALTFPLFIHSHWVILGLVLIFGLVMEISKRTSLLKSIHDVGRSSYGSLYYPIAIYLIFLLASDKPAIYFISLIVLTISDAFAALVGKEYGRIHYEVEGNRKSLEGSLIFFFITFLCVHIPLLLATDVGNIESLLIAFILATLLTGFEAISPSGSDNLIIPFGTYFLLMKMIPLPLEIIVTDVYTLLILATATGVISYLKPSGLIGIMLVNYASVTLGGLLFFYPLILTQLTYSFFLKEKKKFTLSTLFYLGIIPTILLFAANLLHQKELYFIPFLIAIVGQIPLSLKSFMQKAIPLLLVLGITISSLFLYFQEQRLVNSIISLAAIAIIYVCYLLFSQNKKPEEEFRLRLASTTIGTLIAIGLCYAFH